MTASEPPIEEGWWGMVWLFNVTYSLVAISGLAMPWTAYEQYRDDWYMWPVFSGSVLLTAACFAVWLAWWRSVRWYKERDR